MLRYDDIGYGEPIVFLHGLGATKNMWESQHELAKTYRLIIPDMAGHGMSNRVEGFSIKDQAQHVIHLLNHLQIDSAHVCGLSLGGIVAQEVYRQSKQRVKSLILSNTVSYLPTWIGDMAVNKRVELLKRVGNEKYIKHIARNCLHDKARIKQVESVFTITDNYLKCARSANGCNYLPMLPFINKPILVIGSSHDKVTPLSAAYQTHMLSRSKMVTLESGHLSNIEIKEEFNKHVLDFLKQNQF